MPVLSNVEESKTHTVIVYGAPKSGKTELVGKLAQEFNLLWFDLEKGYATLFKMPKSYQQRIQLVALPDTKIYPIAIETMLKVITGKPTDICIEHGKVSCALCKKNSLPSETVHLDSLDDNWIVVVDSLTQLANSCMNHLTKLQDDLYKVEWDDYRNQGSLMDKFLSQVQQAKFNIICITHEAEVEMDDGRKKLVPISGTLNFSRNTAKYFGTVVYSVIKNRKHEFGSTTTYSNNILTGSRTNFDIEKETVATLLNIFRRSKGVPNVLPATPITSPVAINTSKLETVVESAMKVITPIPQEKSIASPGSNALAAIARLKKGMNKPT